VIFIKVNRIYIFVIFVMLIDTETIMTARDTDEGAVYFVSIVYCLWVTGNARLKLMKIKLILE
jgi:hypothetical protein